MKHLLLPIYNSLNFGVANAQHSFAFISPYCRCAGCNFHHFTIASATTTKMQYNICFACNKIASSFALVHHFSHWLAKRTIFNTFHFVLCRLICYFCKLKNHNFLAFRDYFFSIVFPSSLEAVEVKLIEKKKKNIELKKNAAHTKKKMLS